MPTSSESLAISKPLKIFFYKTDRNNTPLRTIEIVRNTQVDSFRNQTSPSTSLTTPDHIQQSTGDLVEEANKSGWKKYLLLTLLGLLLLFGLAIFSMLIATLVLLTKTTTATTIINTTTTVKTTTTAKCVSPYVQAFSGNCVNILVDINNCGKLNNVCPSIYTSCSAGLCSNLTNIKIPNGAFIWASAVNGSVDDSVFNVIVPFNITLYNTVTSTISVTTNGVICLRSCSNTFTETALPTNAFSGAALMPYWNDLYFVANTSQGIYYDQQGSAPNRTFIIEYYCSHYQQSTDYSDFQVMFFESMPGVVQFIYYQATDGGASATIGVQASSSGPFLQYSFDQANSVTSNMVLTFDTITGMYTSGSFG